MRRIARRDNLRVQAAELFVWSVLFFLQEGRKGRKVGCSVGRPRPSGL